MSKFIDFIINWFDPLSIEEKRMERRWQIKLRKIQSEMKKK